MGRSLQSVIFSLTGARSGLSASLAFLCCTLSSLESLGKPAVRELLVSVSAEGFVQELAVNQ